MRSNQMKNMKNRVFSILLVLCMVFTMLPSDALQAAAKKTASDEVKGDSTFEYNNLSNTKSVTRVRRVIKDSSTAGVITDATKTKGTIENPFVILEVTTYPDYSSIGYLVDGCEPVNMDSLGGNKTAIKDLTGNEDGGDFFGFGTFKKGATSVNDKVYFFTDEIEGQRTYYQNTNLTDEIIDGINPKNSEYCFTTDEWNAKVETEAKTLYGYYEVVEKGKGTFILKKDSTTDAGGNTVITRSIVKADNANPAEVAQTTLVWHTTNNYLISQYRAEGVYSDRLFLSLNNLNNATAFPRLKIDYDEDPSCVGNRFYTIREANTDNKYVDVTDYFYIYQSNDLFVRKTLGKSAKDAAKYSVTIKTITPSELKANRDWIDIADLVYFNCDLKLYFDKDKNGTRDDNEAALIDLWQSKNKSDKTLNRFQLEKNTDSTKGFREDNELDSEVVYNILTRLTKNKKYLALVIDSICIDSNYTDIKEEVSYGRYRLNNQTPIDDGYLEIGYKNNLAKLWLACTSANPGMSQKYFFDGGADSVGRSIAEAVKSRFSVDSDGIMSFTNPYMTGEENYWWSGMSFYCAEDRYSGEEKDYKDAYWKNYAGDTMHGSYEGSAWVDDNLYYVQGHVFVTPTGKALVDGYMDSYDSDSINISEDKYEDFNEFLIKYDGASFKANNAQPYRAVKYVVDPDEVVSYYLDDSITVLDIEPSVKMSESGTKYEWEFLGDAVVKMIPKRIGSDTVIKNIDHQVMQQFVSKNDDLNSKYDLIYIGDDIGGLWTGEDLVSANFASHNTTVEGTKEEEYKENVWKPYSGRNKETWYKEGSDGYFDDGARKAKSVTSKKFSGYYYGYYYEYWENGEYGYTNGQGKVEEVIRTRTVNVYGVEGATAGGTRTDFVDNDMDGLVYFHIGDFLKVNTSDRSDNIKHSINWSDKGNYKYDAGFLSGISNTKTRQSGNDLTDKKMKKLVEFLQAEYPVVIADSLYHNIGMEHPYVEQSSQCILKKFLDKYDPGKTAPEAYTYYTRDMLDKIDKMISNRLKGRAQIVDWPKIYNSNVSDVDARYLAAPGGIATLTFEVKVPNTTDYAYRVFVDRNKDSVFTEDWTNDEKNEVITPRMVPLTELENTISVRMPEKWVGFVQWRIEVVNRNNIYKRYSKEGCSAVKADTSSGAAPDRAVQKIVALQIIPTHSTKNSESAGTLVDLSNTNYRKERITNDTWQGLYNEVNDFDITVLKITWWQFMTLFQDSYNAGHKFKFDMGSPINNTGGDDSNPNQDALSDIENKPICFDSIDDMDLNPVSNAERDNYFKLADFNMIVLGFDDGYGFTDMSNVSGCAEYLYYFAQKGCSILFTHDTTSPFTYYDNDPYKLGWKTLYNNTTSPYAAVEVRKYGYTGNTMMRELMGMNRYMKFSKYLTEDTDPMVNFRDDLKEDIQEFVSKYVKYDKGYDTDISKDGLHGYSLYSLKCYVSANTNNGKDGRLQYKYMVLNPKNDSKLYSSTGEGGTKSPTYGNLMSQTVSRVNEGQITQYPFTIGTTGASSSFTTDFKVGDTHGQWWQLNMEDEDLTVWYTLQDPAMSTVSHDGGYDDRLDGTINTPSNDRYIGLMYSAVPQDAANNYYIYSKGNIFYSGVGHSAVYTGSDREGNKNKTEEMKLFVNTLVAAYRPKYGLPFIQVTSAEANLTAPAPSRTYTVTLPVDYLYKEDGSYDGMEVLLADGEFSDTNYVYVKFKAMDNNGCTVIYTKSWYDGDADNKVDIYENLDKAKRGVKMGYREDLVETYELTVGQEYYVRFPKSNLNTSNTKIVFESYNNRVNAFERDVTYLQFTAQPLFKLD